MALLCLCLAVWALLFSASYAYNGAAAFSQRHYWEHREADRGRGGIEGTLEITHYKHSVVSGSRGISRTIQTCEGDFVPADGGAEVTVPVYLPDECVVGDVYDDARLVPATESRWDPADFDVAHVPGGGVRDGKLFMAALSTIAQFLSSGFVTMLFYRWALGPRP